VAQGLEPAAEMMRANTSLHADQARWQIGKSGFHLAARPLLAQHNGTTLIVANDVERVLADIDADDAMAVWPVWDRACSLSWAPLAGFNCWRGRNTAGPSH
jgi:hypothetical protein